MRARLHGFVVVFATFLGTTAEARAWQCFAAPHTLVIPTSAQPAPLNTHVRIRLRHGPVLVDGKQIPCDGPLCDLPALGFALRPAGEPARALAFTQTKVVSGETAVFDLRPTAPFASTARYEVWRTDGNGKDVALLSSFTTSDRLDTEPPTFSPPMLAVFHPYPEPSPKKPLSPRSGRKVVQLDFAERIAPYVSFSGLLPTDAGTRVSDLAFFVWTTDASGNDPGINYERAPDAILSVPEIFRTSGGSEPLFTWGSEDACAIQTLPTPILQGRRRVGVRVVDLAGNQSERQETELDFGK